MQLSQWRKGTIIQQKFRSFLTYQYSRLRVAARKQLYAFAQLVIDTLAKMQTPGQSILRLTDNNLSVFPFGCRYAESIIYEQKLGSEYFALAK
jgi:hypothetical protein